MFAVGQQRLLAPAQWSSSFDTQHRKIAYGSYGIESGKIWVLWRLIEVTFNGGQIAMLRLGMAVLVGMGTLAGCMDPSTPGTNTSEQALDVCQGKMPWIKDWDGAALQPTTPSSVFVAFQYVDKTQASVIEAANAWLISEFEADTGKVLRAVKLSDSDNRFSTLAANLVRLSEQVRIPGIPPDPGCHDDPTLCYPFIAAVVLHTNQALYDARKEAGTCF